MKEGDGILDDGVIGLEISLMDDEKKKSQATLLIEIGQQGQLFHDCNGDAYAEIERDNIKATYKIRSRDYREYLSYRLYELTEKGANSNAIGDAIATLEAAAKFNGAQVIIAVRVYFNIDDIFIDLGCKDRRIIKVHAGGWLYTPKAPVKFIRKNGMSKLPEPKSGGQLQLLNKYINVSEKELPLIYGWIFCAIAGVKPFPILILQGEQGTGKSTTSRVIRSLVDPSTVPLRSPPKDTRNLLVSAANTHCVVLDNLSGINAEMSDCLCRLSTGGGYDVRALFTDNEQYLIDIQKPILCNGIDDVATRPDLAQRAIIANLPVINTQDRKSEAQFWSEFEQDKQLIMGAILKAISSGLKHHKNITLKEKPRMADVAQWVTACERDIGLEGQFIAAHNENQLHAIELGIEASPVGNAIMILMETKTLWDGKPTKLYETLTDIAGRRVTKSNGWPQSVKGLNNIIKRLKPSFRALGVDIDKKYSGSREYTIRKASIYPPEALYPPENSTGKAYSDGGHKTQAPNMAVMRSIKADNIPNRPPSNLEITGTVSVKADRADKSGNILNVRDEEVF